MENFIVRFWGWLLTAVCSLYILRPSICRDILSMMQDRRFVIVSGWFSMLLGALTLASGSQKVRVIAYIFLLSGAFRLSFPETVGRVARFMREREYIPLAVSLSGLIFGVYLLLSPQPP